MKIVLGGNSPQQAAFVAKFLAPGGWAEELGLVDTYGDPARGYAGGYLTPDLDTEGWDTPFRPAGKEGDAPASPGPNPFPGSREVLAVVFDHDETAPEHGAASEDFEFPVVLYVRGGDESLDRTLHADRHGDVCSDSLLVDHGGEFYDFRRSKWRKIE